MRNNKIIWKLTGLIIILITLNGCAESYPIDCEQYCSSNQMAGRATIRPAIDRSAYQLSDDSNPELKKAFNQYLQTGKAPNIITNGFIQFAYTGLQQPVVATTPFQQTVISLEPGERFTNISTADKNRWSYAVAYSGTGLTKQVNVLVTPSVSNISTNMVITTDRRVYDLKLVSTNDGKYVRDVRFWYPNDLVNAINSQDDDSTIQLPSVDLNNLNFNYTISSRNGCFKWKPVRVWDDGKQTYIQMPYCISSRDLPTLFVLSNGSQELVNYRYKQPYFIVDKIFKQAVLVTGVGCNQQKIVIINHCY